MIDWKTARRVRRNLTVPKPTPVAVQINITGRCPCRCWHCEKAVNRGGRDLAWDRLAYWLEGASRWQCPVLYTGGEPLVSRHWRELLKTGLNLGVTQKVITSGVTFPRLADDDRELLQNSLDELMISLDSADPDEHDRLRGVPGLASGISRFLAAGVRPRCTWLVHVPPPDFHTVGPMLELAARTGTGLIVQPFIFISNYPQLAPLAAKSEVHREFPAAAGSITETVSTLVARAAQLGVVTNLGEIELFIGDYYGDGDNGDWFGRKILPHFVCSVPWQQVTIDENGLIQPCVFLRGTEPGPEEDPFTLWRRQAVAFRQQQLAGRVWPECHSCSCHFSSNFRHSLLMFPWSNRSGWTIAIHKKLARLRQIRIRSPEV